MKPTEVFKHDICRAHFCDNWLSPYLYVTPETECPFVTP